LYSEMRARGRARFVAVALTFDQKLAQDKAG
jgi:hypothetical protein